MAQWSGVSRGAQAADDPYKQWLNDEQAIQQALSPDAGSGGGGQFGGTTPAGQDQASQTPPQQAQPGGAATPVTPDGQISPLYAGMNMTPAQTLGQRPEATIPVGGAKSAKSDFSVGSAFNQIQEAYKKYLGRDASPDEVWAQIQGQGWKPGDRWVGSFGLNSILRSIQNSPEAQALQATPAAAATPAATPAATGGGDATAYAPSTENLPAQLALQSGAGGAGGNAAGGGGTPGVGSELDQVLKNLMAGFDPYEFTQYTAPDLSAYETAQLNALMGALGNSEWSPNRIAGQKEVQKEQYGASRDAIAQQLGQSYGSRGRLGGGLGMADLQRLGENTQDQLFGAYRDIDENAAVNRRAELIDTVNAFNPALSGIAGRASTNYITGLAGESAQADQNSAAWNSQLQAAALAIQKALGDAGIAVDWGQIGESGRQFDINHLLNVAKFLQGQYEFDENMGYNYGALNINALNNAINGRG